MAIDTRARTTSSARQGYLTKRNTRAVILQTILPRIVIYLLLILGSVGMLLPFVWMFSSSLKTPAEVYIFPPRWIPRTLQWGNYVEALTVQPFGLYAVNTAIITGLSLIGSVLSCSMVAYGFARLRGVGSTVLFTLVLATMMLPSQVTMIPTFILFRYMGWVNTLKPLFVPSYFGSAFYIFLLRQFMMTVPMEMDEAATIDGCSPVGVFWRVMVPMIKPALATVAIFSFMSNWNDLMTPLIYLNSRHLYTLSLGLANFRRQYETETPWHLLMAASVVVMLPTLLIFFLAQRMFIQGIVVTGLKG